MIRLEYDYLFIVVGRFSKIVMLMPYKKIITREGATRLFFKHV